MERFLYQYLAKEFDENIEYDSSKIKMWSLDIETASENGFPNLSWLKKKSFYHPEELRTKQMITLVLVLGKQLMTTLTTLCDNEYICLSLRVGGSTLLLKLSPVGTSTCLTFTCNVSLVC